MNTRDDTEQNRATVMANFDRLASEVRSGRLEVVVNNGRLLMVDVIPFSARIRGFDHRHVDRNAAVEVE